MARTRNKKRNYTEGVPGEKGEKRYDLKNRSTTSKSGEPGPDKSSADTKQEGNYKGEDKNGVSYRTATNDPEWYAQDPQLLLDSASLSYADPFGQPIVADDPIAIAPSGSEHPAVITPGVLTDAHAVSGICTLYMKHTIGTSINRNDPANVAASAFYSFVRYVNSGRKNYDPADLMIYALMVGDLYAFVQWLKRLYGYAFLYSQMNQYIGKALIEECGVDSADLLNNLANFRYFVNAFINKVSSFVIPSNIPYFNRRRFMYDGLYIENPYGNLKDQLYQFNPEGFYRFTTDADGKGMLAWSVLTTKNGSPRTAAADRLKISDITDYANNLLANIMGDEDFGLMSGDILKAYGSNIMSLESLPEEYYVLPHYDMTVLSQFKNATLANCSRRNQDQSTWSNVPTYKSPNDDPEVAAGYQYGNIYQDSQGNILCKEGYQLNGYESVMRSIYSNHINKVISLEIPAPGPADNIEATRLTVISDRLVSSFNNTMVDFNTGVDFAIGCLMRWNYNHRQAEGMPINVITNHQWIYSNAFDENATVRDIAQSLQFKYAPIMWELDIDDTSFELLDAALMSNVDNYTQLNKRVLDKMHECALLSLFFVPGVAKLVNVLR